MTVIIYFTNGTFIRFNNVRKFDDGIDQGDPCKREVIRFTDEFGAKVVFGKYSIAGYSIGKEN